MNSDVCLDIIMKTRFIFSPLISTGLFYPCVKDALMIWTEKLQQVDSQKPWLLHSMRWSFCAKSHQSWTSTIIKYENISIKLKLFGFLCRSVLVEVINIKNFCFIHVSSEQSIRTVLSLVLTFCQIIQFSALFLKLCQLFLFFSTP